MKNRKLLLYLLFTFGLSWALAGAYWLITGGAASNASGFIIMAMVYMFTPMLSVILVEKAIYKGELVQTYDIRFRWNSWWTVAWLLPLGIALATFGMSLLFPGVLFSPEMEGMFERFAGMLTEEQMDEMRNMELPVHPFFFAILQGLIAGITINAVAGFGEELGWRGLMHRELGHLNFWKMSFLIGAVWGIWHAPVILMGHNYPEHPVAGVGMMVVFCMLFSPVFTLVRIKSGSVVAAAILHGSFNALAGLALMLIQGGNDLLVGVTGLAGFIVLAALNIGIWLVAPETRTKSSADLSLA